MQGARRDPGKGELLEDTNLKRWTVKIWRTLQTSLMQGYCRS